MPEKTTGCSPAADDAFGPQYCDQFDFTLLFEQAFFQILPATVLLLVVLVRTHSLLRERIRVRSTILRTAKCTAILLLAALQLALVVLWAVKSTAARTRTALPAYVLEFISSLALALFSDLEHLRSARPSPLINIYMLFSLILALPQARSLYLRETILAIPVVFTVSIVIKLVIFLLEARRKTGNVLDVQQKESPEMSGNVYSIVLLWWLNPLFWKGQKGLISFSNLYSVDTSLLSKSLVSPSKTSFEHAIQSSKRPLARTIMVCLRPGFPALVASRLCYSALKLCQPLLIHRITVYLSQPQARPDDIGYGLIGAAVLVYGGIAIFRAIYLRLIQRMATQIRTMLLSVIHGSVLTSSIESLRDKSALTLASADVTRIGLSVLQLDNIFAAPVEVGVALFLLERQVGVACVAPMAVILICSLLGFAETSRAITMQVKWLAAVQKRVSYISRVLENPKGFKMLGLTDWLMHGIQELRIKELAAYAGFRKFIALRNGLSTAPMALAPPFTLMMLTLIRGSEALTSSVAFTTLSLVSLLTTPTQDFIHAVPDLLTAQASLGRIQDFVWQKETRSGVVSVSQKATSFSHSRDDLSTVEKKLERTEAVSLDEKEIRYTASESRSAISLENVTVQLGQEKTKILDHVSFDVPKIGLTILIGPVGCGKTTILETVLGEISLLHGRVILQSSNFAYCTQEPWLSNDTIRNNILSGLAFDSEWYSKVVTACALSTDLEAMSLGDQTRVGARGINLSGGQRQRISLARALYLRKEILLADDILSGLDSKTARHVFDHVFGEQGLCRRSGLTVLLATHSTQFLPQANHIVVLEAGKVVQSGSFNDLNGEEGYVQSLDVGSRGHNQARDEVQSPHIIEKSEQDTKLQEMEHEIARQTGDAAVYSHYAKSIGWKYGTGVLALCVCYAFVMKFNEAWVLWWSGSSLNAKPLAVWIGINFLLGTFGILTVFGAIWVMCVMAVPRSSARLHFQLLKAVMQAPYAFFTTTDPGTTLNRFSNDMMLIESQLAFSLMQTLEGGSLCVGSAVLIAVANRYVAIIIPFLALLLYLIQRFYLRTSRQLRLLDLEANAPLISLLQHDIAGVSTIRAFAWQDKSRSAFLNQLDKSARPYYLLLCVQRWLNLVLDLTTAGIGTVVVALGVSFRGTSSAGLIGVSLLNILTFNTQLAYLVTAWTTLETSLGAIARCRDVERKVAPEDEPSEAQQPTPQWPCRGEINFDKVTASYHNSPNKALQNISFHVKAGEKVAICGKTGSGKSTLILTILRLLNCELGSIWIDGVDLAIISRQELRSQLNVIPQEPLVLPSTWRQNLDPRDRHSSLDIENALEKVELLSLVRSAGGIDSEMSASSLSQGQLQLFAVARALLHPSKVVLVDEMTSAIDAATESRMLQLTRDAFKDSTVIAVAHRPASIAGFDKVIVLSSGQIEKVVTPEEMRD